MECSHMIWSSTWFSDSSEYFVYIDPHFTKISGELLEKTQTEPFDIVQDDLFMFDFTVGDENLWTLFLFILFLQTEAVSSTG